MAQSSADALRGLDVLRNTFKNTPQYEAPDRQATTEGATIAAQPTTERPKEFKDDEYEPMPESSQQPATTESSDAFTPATTLDKVEITRRSNAIFARHLPKMVATLLQLAGTVAYRYVNAPKQVVNLHQILLEKQLSGQQLDNAEKNQWEACERILQQYQTKEDKFSGSMTTSEDTLAMQTEILTDIYNTLEEEKDPKTLVWLPSIWVAVQGAIVILTDKVTSKRIG